MTTSTRRFVNTDYFREPALHFLKHGYYTEAYENTQEWEEYWVEQLDRCLNGYTVGGMSITGYHYFYLNFCQILLVPKGMDERNMNVADKIQTFPAFWDGDYEYFHAIEIARYGISPLDYEKLDMQTKIEWLEGGKHLVVLKARGKGYSYKCGAMLARNYQLKKRSKNYAIADEKEYLLNDGLLSKVWDNIAFLDAHTAWKQPRLKDTELHKRSGYLAREASGYVAKGNRSEVIGVTLKNNADKARGKRGELIMYEEAGKCPVLLSAWEINRPSIEQGSIVTGIQIAFGTGGTEDADYAGLEELFYHPEAYNCLPFENIWDEGGHGSLSGFFVPAWQNWEGNMDADGNSDEEPARAFINRERENKKKAKDNKALEQYVSENPLTPREATLQVDLNIFPTMDLQMHYNALEAHKRYNVFPSGFLVENEKNVMFLPSPNATPILKYPMRKGENENGAIVIFESPTRDETGTIPDDLYIIVHDPYAKDKSSSSVSLGAAYVIKMVNNISPTFGGCPVASYVGRPDTLDQYNENLFRLARYYNAKIAFENNRGNVVEYAKRHRMLKWLLEEPSSAKVKTNKIKTGKETKIYGMTMTETHKDTAEIYLRDWLNETVGVGTDGETMKRLHLLFDPALITELIKFSRKGNFDRVSAMLLGQFFVKDLIKKQSVPKKPKSPLIGLMRRKMFT